MAIDLNEETMFLQQSANLEHLLPEIMANISAFMNADRSTLFLYDEQNNELWSEVAQGSSLNEIRIAADKGIAGHVMQTGETVNIKDAYQDERFNSEFDKQNDFKTKTMLCQAVVSSDGRRIGVVQVLNKHDGLFTEKDEQLLSA
ncbi:MAG: GAF domain-containing protein, partial [Gammaproteobacteria bacterium]